MTKPRIVVVSVDGAVVSFRFVSLDGSFEKIFSSVYFITCDFRVGSEFFLHLIDGIVKFDSERPPFKQTFMS